MWYCGIRIWTDIVAIGVVYNDDCILIFNSLLFEGLKPNSEYSMPSEAVHCTVHINHITLCLSIHQELYMVVGGVPE